MKQAVKLNTFSDHYGWLSISIHWLTLILIAAAYASIELRELYPKGSDPRAALKNLHYAFGLSVFCLVWLRLAVRSSSARPAILPPPPRWQEVSGRLMHYALYAVMIGLPLLGWLALSAAGKPIPFLGLQLPALIAESKADAKLIEEIHELVGQAGYFLVGIHAAAGLFHHFVVRDNTLLRMLPGRA